METQWIKGMVSTDQVYVYIILNQKKVVPTYFNVLSCGIIFLPKLNKKVCNYRAANLRKHKVILQYILYLYCCNIPYR